MKKSILAGILISLGASMYLKLLPTSPIVGSIFFVFGLISVFALNATLYTGWIGTINDQNYKSLPTIVTGNFIGCFMVAIYWYLINDPDIINSAQHIYLSRSKVSIVEALVRATFCGCIMDIVCRSWRTKGTTLPALFGVPLFIICGFYHSVADTFYYFVVFLNTDLLISEVLWVGLVILQITILGNAIGAYIIRELTKNEK